MSRSTQLLAMLLSCTLATVVQAHGGSCEEGTCPIEAAMKNLPKITFAVGDETLTCEKSAIALAKESGVSMRYRVGNEEFDTKSDAQVALVDATENFVSTFAEPQTCKTTGKITVAGTELHCIFCARSLAKKANEAMDGIHMTYLVGTKECTCPKTAAKLAEEAGVDRQFVIGEEKTCCEYTARLQLAHAKYKAAVAALTAAPAKKEAPGKGQGT